MSVDKNAAKITTSPLRKPVQTQPSNPPNQTPRKAQASKFDAQNKIKKRSIRRNIAVVILVVFFVGGLLWSLLKQDNALFGRKEPIKVGVLHSLTGTMAISEKSVVDATLLAIDQINEKGGVLGRRVEAIVVDGESNWEIFAIEAERLITKEEVSVIFGCWTSACRKTVKPVFEKYNHLLFYPIQYEGLELSPNIIYTGAAPNQQIIPGVKWALDNLGKRVFLVASDYVFPRAANEIIKDYVAALGGEVVGEEYVFLGSTDVQEMIEQIITAQPDVILNTINGDTNIAFFEELRKAGITPEKIPSMSFSIAENELQNFEVEDMVGDYAVWNYFQTIENKENISFVQEFKEKYGANRVTDDPMEAGFFGVHLWAQTATEIGTDDPNEVRKAVKNQSLRAPEGIIYIDPETQHTWKTVRIGKIRQDGQFEIVWTSQKAIRPVPYPLTRTRDEWEQFLKDLYKGWGNNWANPSTN